MQLINEIEESYKLSVDPWGYQTNNEDIKRKSYILSLLRAIADNEGKSFSSALDIGCGEGWITKDIPAYEIYGYDCSATALSRLPQNVVPVTSLFAESQYDLILATGIFYDHYNLNHFINVINSCGKKYILLCNIKSWESSRISEIKAKEIYSAEFPYREYVQQMRMFKRT